MELNINVSRLSKLLVILKDIVRYSILYQPNERYKKEMFVYIFCLNQVIPQEAPDRQKLINLQRFLTLLEQKEHKS